MTLGGRVWRGRSASEKPTKKSDLEKKKNKSPSRTRPDRKVGPSDVGALSTKIYDAPTKQRQKEPPATHAPSLPTRGVSEQTRNCEERPKINWKLEDVPLTGQQARPAFQTKEEKTSGNSKPSRLICITASEEFANWSADELRYKAYKSGVFGSPFAATPRSPYAKTNNNMAQRSRPSDNTGHTYDEQQPCSFSEDVHGPSQSPPEPNPFQSYCDSQVVPNSFDTEVNKTVADDFSFIGGEEKMDITTHGTYTINPTVDRKRGQHPVMKSGKSAFPSATCQPSDAPACVSDAIDNDFPISWVCDGNEDEMVKWVTGQLTSSNDFTRVLRDALRIQARQLIGERDRAVEQRNVAEQEAVAAGMELMNARNETESCQAEKEQIISDLRKQIETIQQDREAALAALHITEEENKAGMREVQDLEDELNAASLQAADATKQCEELSRAVRHLEFRLRKSEQQNQSMQEDLKEAKNQAQHGMAMRKQLAESLLRSLDMPYGDITAAIGVQESFQAAENQNALDPTAKISTYGCQRIVQEQPVMNQHIPASGPFGRKPASLQEHHQQIPPLTSTSHTGTTWQTQHLI